MDAIVRIFRGDDKEAGGTSPNSVHLREMLKSKHPRRDRTVDVGDRKSPPGASKQRASCFVRAIVCTYLALVENGRLNMDVHSRDLRTVDEPVFDPHNALALACSMCIFLLNNCSRKHKENYFKSNAGRCVLVSVITLSLKFSKAACFYLMPLCAGNGFHSTASMVFYFMFGNYRPNYGITKSLSDMLYETECHLLSKMGGHFFKLYHEPSVIH